MAQGPREGTTDTGGAAATAAASEVGTARLLDFEGADVEAIRTTPAQFMLVVRGETPFVDLSVELVPHAHVHKPEYWGIEVVGHAADNHVRRTMPYTASLLLTGITGTRGVEVIGSEGTVRLDVPDVAARTS